MSTSTATLRHTSSRANDNALRLARVAAAGRVRADRIAAERRAAEAKRIEVAQFERVLASATEWVEDIRALGAVEVGFKVCLAEGGKWRTRTALDDAARFLARATVEDDVEAWGIDAAGDNVVNGGW